MTFTPNKYTRWYYNIVDRAKTRALKVEVYSEKHHIIPKSLGGSNRKDNIVQLTGREHFICHWLLTKMTEGPDKSKMWHAFNAMSVLKPNNTDKRYINSRASEKAKIECANLKRLARKGILVGEKNYNYGKKWTDEQKSKMIGHTRTLGHKYTQPYTEERKFKMRVAAQARWTEEERNKMKVPKSKYYCSHCNTLVGGKSNFNRWHNDNCKLAGDKIA
jgi:hypothetical protein